MKKSKFTEQQIVLPLPRTDTGTKVAEVAARWQNSPRRRPNP